MVVVTVAKKHDDIEEFFEQLVLVVIVICGSCKRKDMIREMQKERVATEIEVVVVLRYVKEEGSTLSNRNQENGHALVFQAGVLSSIRRRFLSSYLLQFVIFTCYRR
ncbi:unnamed protein product [Lactuca saligna]|uniref:Uncharacterized protein n=1 Tax=Lactuca saligna TaxID=75948 RepID=A0AA35Y620_LACSI|nr:unnamed protein product [Lactuca saligna]